ncbi:hypothetical protein BDW02DRAFT_488543 [Decorospora gaudefroyi]|uniref:Uncharacterized protein n=1 Tax=Decorospora gaudefroyi TaxID=184978 RepID=A0A6A5KY33_9PLEO|nr:hypothetical protein BDW02DRAFT_488543 [Decorospora gaudefroyi]
MGSEWHPRRHPQHPEPTPAPAPAPAPAPVRTQLSIAELTSSSADSALHRPRDSVPPTVSRRTPPTVPAANDFANPPPLADHSAFTPINHASPHVSPTNTRAPPPASEHQRYLYSLPHASVAPFSPPLTSGPCQSVPDAAPLQTAVASLRQDSAHRIDTIKEVEPTLPSSVRPASYLHSVANHGRQSNTSRPISHPGGPSSPHSPASEPRSNQAPPEAGAHGQKRGHSQVLSSGAHIHTESTRSPDLVAGSPATANTDIGPKITPILPPILDQTNGSNRHQRYNVRFNTVSTLENMSPTQKPRNDPPPSAPVTVEPHEPQTRSQEQTVRPSVEPPTPSAVPGSQPIDDSLQFQLRSNVPQLERCRGCKEPWKRPLPGEQQYRLSSPAQNKSDQAALTQDLIESLKNHAKYADDAYAAWQKRHRWCGEAAPSPPATDNPSDSLSQSAEEPACNEPPACTSSTNKRKSEVPHDPSKYRKVVSFETQSNTTPHMRPTAPA